MKLKCNSVQRLLSDYIDGVLPDGQLKLVNQHLASCSKCRTALSALKRTTRMLNLYYIEDEPPDGYFDKVWMQIEDKITERTKAPGLFWPDWIKIKDNLSLKFRMLKNKIYDEFDWWSGQIKWSKLFWQSVMVIVLIVSAIAIDRTYFRPSIDKTLLQNITQSLSEDGFYLIRYSQKKPAIEGRMPLRRAIDSPRPNVNGNGLFPSHKRTVELKNGFLTFVGNIEISDIGRAKNYSHDEPATRSTKEPFSFVDLSGPKNIARIKIIHIKEPQPQINVTNIQDIQQSFTRRKDSNNESPFRVFLSDVPTSGLSFENIN